MLQFLQDTFRDLETSEEAELGSGKLIVVVKFCQASNYMYRAIAVSQ